MTVFDHTCNEWQSCYKNSGIAAAVTEAGGKVLPANLKEHYSRVERPEAGENEERPDPQRDPRSGCVHQRAGAQTPRRSQNVLRDEEFHGAGRRPRLHAPERSAAVHRRRGALPQAGPQRGGRLPHRDLQRAARRDAGGCENSEIPAAFPRHRRGRYDGGADHRFPAGVDSAPETRRKSWATGTMDTAKLKIARIDA